MSRRPSATLITRSSRKDILWPALPRPDEARRLALLYQLEASQWWSPEVLRAQQFRQLTALLDHAARTVPYYAERLRQAGIEPGAPLTEAAWARIPLLTCDDIQDASEAQYTKSLPTNLLHLAEDCLREAIELPNLRDVGTLDGVLQPEVRDRCRQAWGVPVIDLYSAQEVGYIALQCPEEEHYHLQAESALVEVLDAQGRPCQPGAWGRVVVTPLHNFAMPLIRYDIGDNAEVGEACACGRGLPVLKRILGRVRNMLTLTSGEQISPGFVNDWFEGFPVNQFQIVQRAMDRLEVKIVPGRLFTDSGENRVREGMRERIGHPFQIIFTYHDEIPRGPGGKYEDFKSDI